MEQQTTEILQATQAAAIQASTLAVQYSFSIIGALILLILGWLAAGLLRGWAFRALSRIRGFDETLARFFSNALRYAILILVVVMVLGQFGVQTASIIAALGAAGLAIGLALQGTLQNIAAGIMLLVLRPFRVGEYIETASISGTITEIGLFATEMKTPDGLYRLAPNSTLWNVPITNFSREDTRRHDLTVTVGLDADIDKAEALLMGLARQDKRVLDSPAPEVFVADLTETGALITLRYWVQRSLWWRTTRDLTRAAKLALDETGKED
ncbi:mechanosensitive ion channel family protein [Rhizobiaceae bacterium BDR2-2]|uniref:Small-conductance mechanosensitive channel n=1 Tax=Ectorhizobium quercum TaxID=2965071 RepID=A0AAE3N4H3_9HYPH|nr:mechanosensitive ion channel family protein [Ectorhizobium quercum]MCX8999075.1 mechanosensitive ion channel family protein [Ectorhizobium quercum]